MENNVCGKSAHESYGRLYTAEQLMDFAESVNSGDNFRRKIVALDVDIMLNDTTNWKSWGSTVCLT